MTERSNLREVRNPVLALPAAKRLLALPADQRAIIAEILGDLALDSRARGEKCWRTHKAPMAAYWKAVSVYAGHFRRVCRMMSRGPLTTAPRMPRDEILAALREVRTEITIINRNAGETIFNPTATQHLDAVTLALVEEAMAEIATEPTP